MLPCVADLSNCCVQDSECLLLPTPAHQPFTSNSLGPSAPDEDHSRNVRTSGTLKLRYEDLFFRFYKVIKLLTFIHSFIHSFRHVVK